MRTSSNVKSRWWTGTNFNASPKRNRRAVTAPSDPKQNQVNKSGDMDWKKAMRTIYSICAVEPG